MLTVKIKFSINRRFFSTELLNPKTVIKKVGVVGMGLMGHGIVQVVAHAGYKVQAIEFSDMAMSSGMQRINSMLTKVISKEKIEEDEKKKKVDEILSRISTASTISAAHDCDLIIEAISEDVTTKTKFYQSLGEAVQPSAIFASNTSSLSITQLGLAANRPSQFVGLHFFNPVQLMKLVEVVRTEDTSDAIFHLMLSFTKDIGKVPVSCVDTPGFVVNRLLVPYLAQAMAMVDRKVASIADIDISMQLGAGHPMGPLHLADYIGLDTCRSILSGWIKAYPEEKAFFIPGCLDTLVARGDLGRKSGRGFYTWTGDKIGAPTGACVTD